MKSRTQNSEGAKVKGKIRENVEAILIAIVLAMFIRTFIVQAFKIPSGSMKETLQIGDHILVNKFIYGVKIPFTDMTLIPVTDPDREDIVVFKYPEDPSKDFIKRVIGVAGDVVEIRNKNVYINGQPMEHPHYVVHTDNRIFPATFSSRDNLGPFTVPENSLFVMGDNRDNSHDSRFWGMVDLGAVRGKAFIIYWSWNSEKKRVRWSRIGDLLR